MSLLTLIFFSQGKSLIVSEVAARLKASLVRISVFSLQPDTIEQQLHEKFQEAIKDQTIVYIEQLDLIAPICKMAYEKIYMKFANFMINKYPKVFVVAVADCHEKHIDPDIRYRFDVKFQIGLPNKKERLDILKIQTKDMSLDDDVILKKSRF